ncbi:hypothetical protein [Streptomyces showdoensis]|uniref:Uncharacterized protein n=1 Tax=Streptomyces showdoensis TaxID=68268 RepID=A0A2P2GKK5_STREW|nr:hypothetical protein [Streptomyces showdoensis]KKZ72044.1 hypothetical protein VO63_19840 [Streptomyces showdoensis]
MNQDRTKTPTSIYTASHGAAEALRRARLDDANVARPARRTLAEMAPGFERQPVLRLAPAVERSEVDAARAAVRRLTTYVESPSFQSVPCETQAAALDNLRFEKKRLAKLTASNERCPICDMWLCPGTCGGFTPSGPASASKVVA